MRLTPIVIARYTLFVIQFISTYVMFLSDHDPPRTWPGVALISTISKIPRKDRHLQFCAHVFSAGLLGVSKESTFPSLLHDKSSGR